MVKKSDVKNDEKVALKTHTAPDAEMNGKEETMKAGGECSQCGEAGKLDADGLCSNCAEKAAPENETMKAEGSAVDPAESGAASNVSPNTLTPGYAVPDKAQHVLVPQSSINVSREQVTPMSKSADVDLTKSPLFNNISKQMNDLQATLGNKVEALEKSVNDRLKNIKGDMEKIEKFYSQSFYKAAGENVGPEAVLRKGISEQIKDGAVRYSN